MNKLRKDDIVEVISGKDKGKKGLLLSINRRKNRVIVEGVHLVKKCIKPNPNKGVDGGIIEKELPVHASNVAIYNQTTKKADRVGFKYTEEKSKVRYFKSSNELTDL